MERTEKFCLRCYLDGLEAGPEPGAMAEYIARIDPEQRAAEAVYRKRLETCAGCSSRIGGVCRLCGCFVELRAARAFQCCPDVPARWAAQPHSAL